MKSANGVAAVPDVRRGMGFTLIELVTTMIIIGILAVFAVGRLDFTSAFDQKGVRDQALAALQFARKSAVAQRRYVCVRIIGGTLSLTIDTSAPENTASEFGGTCPFATPLTLPAADKGCGGASNAVCSRTGATISSSPTGAFQFDAQGRSSTDVGLTVTGQPTITCGNGATATICVEGETGYVH